MEQSEILDNKPANMEQGKGIILRLTYVSRHNPDNTSIEVTRILAQARRNNERNGITGALVINDDYFLQSIEGARPVINGLLRKLVNDNRHFDLHVIECSEVEERVWNKWSMKHLTPSDYDKEYVRKFSAGTVFDPYIMSTSQILKFIDTLSALQERKEKGNTDTKSLGF
ncbi:BLUF domain-containing protein [Psychrobacter sp. B38]|uniref:BLUF domain-containing protein n=1 Tax=Psychrobacter sp. B38 TaxID=3143538 RepID=UPI00320DCEDB